MITTKYNVLSMYRATLLFQVLYTHKRLAFTGSLQVGCRDDAFYLSSAQPTHTKRLPRVGQWL